MALRIIFETGPDKGRTFLIVGEKEVRIGRGPGFHVVPRDKGWQGGLRIECSKGVYRVTNEMRHAILRDGNSASQCRPGCDDGQMRRCGPHPSQRPPALLSPHQRRCRAQILQAPGPVRYWALKSGPLSGSTTLEYMRSWPSSRPRPPFPLLCGRRGLP